MISNRFSFTIVLYCLFIKIYIFGICKIKVDWVFVFEKDLEFVLDFNQGFEID